MINNIDQINVLDLFQGNCTYKIPIYQRNYAWGEEQIQALIDDIMSLENNNNQVKYYLGTLIADKKHEEKQLYEVVDGQQRLTTLFLLLHKLNEHNEYNINAKSLIFEARKLSNEILEKLPCDNLSFDEENGLLRGYAIIEGILQEKREYEINFLKENLKRVDILRVQVPKNIDLNHYFEVMNTRGEQLELHEIVKNRIIQAFDGNKAEENAAATIWDACFNMDRYVQMNFNSRDRRILFSDNWDKFEYENFDEIVSELKACQDEDTDDTEANINDILENKYIEKPNKDKNNPEESDKKIYSSIIKFPQLLLHVNLIINKEKENEDIEKKLDDKKLIEHLKQYYTKDAAKVFIYNLLKYRFYFDKFIIKRETENLSNETDGNWFLGSLKKYEYSGKEFAKPEPYKEDKTDKELLWLQSCLRITYTSPKTMYWITEVLKSVDKYTKRSELKNKLEMYCIEKLKKARKPDSAIFFGNGFDIPRIVFTYLDYLLCRENFEEYKNFEFKYRSSIEHFYPQHPEGLPVMNSEYLDNFGNLALITVSGNSKLSNKSPEVKAIAWKEVMKQSIKLQLMAQKSKNWREYEIENHGNKMLKYLEEEMNKI